MVKVAVSWPVAARPPALVGSTSQTAATAIEAMNSRKDASIKRLNLSSLSMFGPPDPSEICLYQFVSNAAGHDNMVKIQQRPGGLRAAVVSVDKIGENQASFGSSFLQA